MEKKDMKPMGYWQNYDHCYGAAKECKDRTEFQKKYGGAYRYANKYGWLNDYTWFKTYKNGFKEYLTYDKCYEIAKQCKSKTEFAKKSHSAYQKSLRNKWIKDYTWFKRNVHCDDDYEIYAYEDRENKVVYVGLTYRLFGNGGNNRHNEHKRIDDPVGKYFNRKIPMPRRLMQDLSQEDAQYYEDWYKKAYADNGWTLLNKAKTGVGSSSLGGVNIVWDYESCYEEALKYTSKNEFYKNSGSVYNVALRNKWLDNYTWLEEKQKPSGYWANYDNCYAEAKKYTTIKDFRKCCSAGYKWSLANGWLNDYTWFKQLRKPSGYWANYDNCYNEARKYETLTDFVKNAPNAYEHTVKNGWINNYYWLKRCKKENGYWGYEHCKEEAKKYSGRRKFCKGASAAYEVSRKNGWLDEFFPKAA